METIDEVANLTNDRFYIHPSMSDYYSHLSPFLTLCIFISALLVILNIAIFCTTVAQLKQRLTKDLLSTSTALCSLYPIISVSALLTLLIPSSWLICHTVMHICFAIGAIFFHRLCLLYIGSETSFIKESAGAAVTIRTPPLCCCCCCLPGVTPSPGKFVILRCFVWQMLFVQGSIMAVLNSIYYNDRELFVDVHYYFLPFIIASIIVGVWGLNITVRVVNVLHSDYGMIKKMFSLQLIIILCKMQFMILNGQLDSFDMGGEYPLNHIIYKQTFINVLILVEMVLVSLLAQNAYRIPAQIEAE